MLYFYYKIKKGKAMKLLRLVPQTSMVSRRVMNITLAFLILFSIVLNSFIPVELSNRETVVQVIGAVTQSFVVKTVKGCTDTLMAMSNRMMEDLRKFLRMTETGATTPISKDSSENQTPVNTSSSSGIVIESGNYSEKIRAYIEESTPIVAAGKISEQLYKLYCNLKICGDERNNIGLLSFILFILVIERRKFWEAVKPFAAEVKTMKGKANLC